MWGKPSEQERRGQASGADGLDAYWSLALDDLLAALRTGTAGLTTTAAHQRLKLYGPNALRPVSATTALRLFLRQFQSPLLLILIFAAIVAAALKQWVDASIVLIIVGGSALVSFAHEQRTAATLKKLQARIRIAAVALRDGRPAITAIEDVVPGDIVMLSAGSLVPGDGVILEAKDFFVTEATLTGEPLPVEKRPGFIGADAGLGERSNCIFMGTSVRSGTARALIVRTGTRTEYGGIADRLRLRPPETEFERGVRRYGAFLTEIMAALVVVVFAANVFLDRPTVDALLFAIALAVGISPELLPAIISMTLSTGARRMAAKGVLVRHLNAIENFGSMDVLCTDKTGTLTRGVMSLDGAFDAKGQASRRVLRDAVLNAGFQTGLENALDEAVLARGASDGVTVSGARKLDEIPYDFERKRLSVVVEDTASGTLRLIAKGAVASILDICDSLEESEGSAVPLTPKRRKEIETLFAGWSAQGFRVLALATKSVGTQDAYSRQDELGLIFTGFLLFLDPPKKEVIATLADLARMGVKVKIITGDNRLVAAHLASTLGWSEPRMLTGPDLNRLHDGALPKLAAGTDLFAEVDPHQKERIVYALKKAGHVVGYLGDGINDVAAMHAADVSVSVDKAVDVAREAADFILLEHDLGVLRDGIAQGRQSFANTLKYVNITTSANFGNMISMALVSMFLPFLPLLAKQILLNNFLSDLPAVGIAGDAVDADMIGKPRRWDIGELRRFMIVFGLISSVFDFLTFGVLLYVFHASPETFRTGWFVESLLTELAIILVVRTYRPLHRSRPGALLLYSTLAVAAITVALPYVPIIADALGFVPLPWPLAATMIAITGLYTCASELAKWVVHRRNGAAPPASDGHEQAHLAWKS